MLEDVCVNNTGRRALFYGRVIFMTGMLKSLASLNLLTQTEQSESEAFSNMSQCQHVLKSHRFFGVFSYLFGGVNCRLVCLIAFESDKSMYGSGTCNISAFKTD